CFTQPDRALEEQFLGIILHPPGNIFPMLHGRTLLPVPFAFRQEWLIEFYAPLGNIHLIIPDLKQWFCRSWVSIRSQAHHLAALIPVPKDVDRNPALQRSKARHVVEFITQKSANRVQPDFFERFDPGAVKLVITLCFASQWINIFSQLIGFSDIRTVVADS